MKVGMGAAAPKGRTHDQGERRALAMLEEDPPALFAKALDDLSDAEAAQIMFAQIVEQKLRDGGAGRG